MQLRPNELVVDGKVVCLMSHVDSYVLEPKCSQVRDLSITSLYESWHKATRFDPDTCVVIELDDDQRFPWESDDLEDVYISKEKDYLVVTLHTLTAYPESRESYSNLVESIDMAHAFSIESFGVVKGKSYRSAQTGREWEIRLICKSRSATFDDLFKLRRSIARVTFDTKDYDDKSGLIFRIYVPSDRLYSAETDKLVTLFHEWLSSTGRNNVRLDRYRTPTGQAYEFFGDESLNREHLSREFNTFSNFLDLCVRSSSGCRHFSFADGSGACTR